MRSNKIMGINTNTLLLIAGAGVALYLITKPKTPVLPLPGTPGYYPPGYYPPQSGAAQTTALAGDVTSVLNNLFNNIF